MVELAEHRHEWASLYATESAAVAAALGPYAKNIEHIGSTAVPGLLGKPIIDILVAGIDTPSRPVVEALEGCGFKLLGEDGRRPGRWMLQKRGAVDVNLSIVPAGGALWRDNVIFRDYLRASSSARERYAAAKLEAVRSAPCSAQGYQDHKRAAVEALKVEARQWAQARSGGRATL